MRDSFLEEVILFFGVVEFCEYSKIVMDFGFCDKVGVLKGILFDGEVLK